jgi:hypothetical protein
MKGWAWYACALLAAGCVREQGAAEDVDCGRGQAVQMDGQSMCVYTDAIIETGFRCPDGMQSFDRGPLTVCAQEEPPPDFADRWCAARGEGCDERPDVDGGPGEPLPRPGHPRADARVPDLDAGPRDAATSVQDAQVAGDAGPLTEPFEPIEPSYEGVALVQPYIRLSPPPPDHPRGQPYFHGADQYWPALHNFGADPVRYEVVEIRGAQGFGLVRPDGDRTIPPGGAADAPGFWVGHDGTPWAPSDVDGSVQAGGPLGQMTLRSDAPGAPTFEVQLIGMDQERCLAGNGVFTIESGESAAELTVRRCGAGGRVPTLERVTIDDPEERLFVGPLPPNGVHVELDVRIPIRVVSRPVTRYIARIHFLSDDPYGPHQITHVVVEP